MRLYIKQKVFSWKDKFSVKDESGNDLYYIEGKLLSVGKKLRVFDKNEKEIAFIKQKVLSILPKFIVEIDGEEIATISKKFTVFKDKYTVAGLDWEVRGDVFSHDYEIVEENRTVASVHKKRMSWGDSFEVDIERKTDVAVVLGVVLAIDAVLDSRQAAASSAASSN